MYAVIDGGIAPVGRITVSGAKNSATRLLAAALLSDEPVDLSNFPSSLVDVGHKIGFARAMGASVEVDGGDGRLRVDARGFTPHQLERAQLDLPVRTTYLLAAAQLARSGVAYVPYPGGCPIGPGPSGQRGYDLHVMVWERLGCTVEERADHIYVAAPAGLRGSSIDFPISTVGGTENALLCASVAAGETRISNAYITPEIEDLIKLLRQMGAVIEVYGTSHLVVQGRAGLLAGARMPVMPDRIEALTWIVYAVIARGDLTVEGVPFEAMEVPLTHLQHAGIDFYANSRSIQIKPDCFPSGRVEPFELACGAHPGVISDMQAFFVLLALVGAGTSRIYDYRYPERIAFVRELAKHVQGSHLEAMPGRITVRGPARFQPAVSTSTDLRGSMASVLAALVAPGRSVVQDVQMAMRGYDNLEGKLHRLGSRIQVHEDVSPVDRELVSTA
ncbi:UDP-N-acetylglucosamine 1-carboxyvinyltransferase [Amnibacterium sp. CER49]|uniref:UDP-N-acetylglucosamine 1-carboxyvinyltransferase n=1 Tax=Amnibacterium sp. CER49 TaxID=3039161 RepID=UPI002446EF12|nr:UDP-N-acetylglucosamine 1-carboxyvinyltransferase [Amnibacterium sp. CER49]MDH2443015.1 UDP-N-acetylglucosamine 1-carboxyvinyltransferase [Amnibacterium sp. CER49]